MWHGDLDVGVSGRLRRKDCVALEHPISAVPLYMDFIAFDASIVKVSIRIDSFFPRHD